MASRARPFCCSHQIHEGEVPNVPQPQEDAPVARRRAAHAGAGRRAGRRRHDHRQRLRPQRRRRRDAGQQQALPRQHHERPRLRPHGQRRDPGLQRRPLRRHHRPDLHRLRRRHQRRAQRQRRRDHRPLAGRREAAPAGRLRHPAPAVRLQLLHDRRPEERPGRRGDRQDRGAGVQAHRRLGRQAAGGQEPPSSRAATPRAPTRRSSPSGRPPRSPATRRSRRPAPWYLTANTAACSPRCSSRPRRRPTR